MEKTIAVLPGDGIGPEVTEAAVKVLKSIAMRYGHTFHWKFAAIGERRSMNPAARCRKKPLLRVKQVMPSSSVR